MKIKNKLSYILFTVLVIGLVFRLIPTTIFNEPYSTDVWPLIRISRKLLDDHDLKIFDDSFFDGYNNRWPGVIMSTTIVSIVSAIDIFIVYRYLDLVFITVTFSILVYILLKTLYKYKNLCSIGLLYFLSAPSLIVFTSALLKEVYAYVFLYLLLIYALRKWNSLRVSVLLIFIVSLGLIISHYFVTLMTIGILSSTLIVYLIARTMGHIRNLKMDYIILQIMLILTIVSINFSIYYTLYGHTGLKFKLTVYDLLHYLFYSIFVFSSYTLYLKLNRGFELKIVILAIISFLLILATILDLPMLPGLELKSRTILYYIIPAILPLFMWLSNREMAGQCLLCGIFLFLMINVLFIVFSKPELSSIFHRIINYMILANTLLVTFSLTRKITRERSLLISTSALSIVSLVFGGIVVIGIAMGIDDLVYYWSYREPEVHGFSYPLEYSLDKITFSGDAKVLYFLGIEKNVDVTILFKNLYLDHSVNNDTIILLYKDNYVWGIVVSLNIYKIDRFIEQMIMLNRIYDNVYVNIVIG